MKTRLAAWMAVLVGLMALNANAKVTPFNSWRALIVYTNSVDSIYGDGGNSVNMYRDYFAAVFDALNQTYANSGIDMRAQIAGVVWDKTYAQSHSGAQYPGCENKDDLRLQRNGMKRHVDLLTKYGADAIILIHQNEPGGCANNFFYTKSGGYAAFWTQFPNNAYVFAHEMGHNSSNDNNNDHCLGHRVTINAAGNQVAGRSPDTVSFIKKADFTFGPPPVMIPADTIVYTAPDQVSRGFYTSMAYAGGDAPDCIHGAWHFQGGFGGPYRVFGFYHHGVPGSADSLEWTGTYSKPGMYWVDQVMGNHYAMGFDSVYYINRLRYLPDAFNSFKDSTRYVRSFADTVDLRADSLVNLKGIPSTITVTADMSLGANAADTQWVYAHLAATSSVSLQPGFRVGDGSYLRITVGQASDGDALAKRGIQAPPEKNAGTDAQSLTTHFDAAYNRASQTITFSLRARTSSDAVVSIYDLKGARKKDLRFNGANKGSFSRSVSVKDLPNGIYLMRTVIDGKTFSRQFAKW
jgi:hypothetical protein